MIILNYISVNTKVFRIFRKNNPRKSTKPFWKGFSSGFILTFILAFSFNLSIPVQLLVDYLAFLFDLFPTYRSLCVAECDKHGFVIFFM